MPAKLPLLRRLRYLFEAFFVYLFYFFFKFMPLDLASDTGGRIMRFIGPKLSASRKARRNLEFALPELSNKQREDVIEGMWENLGRIFAEYPHLDKIADRIEVEGIEHFDEIKKNGGPAIFVGGHFANWEVCALSSAVHGIPLHLVYRKPNNMYVDGLLQKARYRAKAVSNIPKGAEGARMMINALKNKEFLGVLMDQKNNKGVPVPFFGKDAMTAPAAMQFGLRFDCPIYPARIERLNGARFKATLFPAIKVPDVEDHEDAVFMMLQDLHNMFESWIKDQPSQWLWLHRRWPKGEV